MHILVLQHPAVVQLLYQACTEHIGLAYRQAWLNYEVTEGFFAEVEMKDRYKICHD